ncbi:hypothetical protein ABZP36_006145 [Zizania latifolia]
MDGWILLSDGESDDTSWVVLDGSDAAFEDNYSDASAPEDNDSEDGYTIEIWIRGVRPLELGRGVHVAPPRPVFDEPLRPSEAISTGGGDEIKEMLAAAAEIEAAAERFKLFIDAASQEDTFWGIGGNAGLVTVSAPAPPATSSEDVVEHTAPVDDNSTEADRISVVEAPPVTVPAAAPPAPSSEGDKFVLDDEHEGTKIRSSHASSPTPGAVVAQTANSPPPPRSGGAPPTPAVLVAPTATSPLSTILPRPSSNDINEMERASPPVPPECCRSSGPAPETQNLRQRLATLQKAAAATELWAKSSIDNTIEAFKPVLPVTAGEACTQMAPVAAVQARPLVPPVTDGDARPQVTPVTDGEAHPQVPPVTDGESRPQPSPVTAEESRPLVPPERRRGPEPVAEDVLDFAMAFMLFSYSCMVLASYLQF